MPKAYSDDLRWRVIWKKFDGYTIKQTSKDLLVSESFVKKIRSRFALFATVDSPYFCPRGPARILMHDDIQFLRTLMRQRTDWYLYEIQTELEHRTRRSISISTIWVLPQETWLQPQADLKTSRGTMCCRPCYFYL